MNRDDNPWNNRIFIPGDYIDAQNIRIFSTNGGNKNVLETVRGNVEILFPLPSGRNKVIGCYEDTQEVSVVYFVWNENSNHMVLRYYPQFGVNGEVHLLLQTPELNFSTDHLIQASMVDSMTTWTDKFNEPRKINVGKADDVGKIDEFNAYFLPLPSNATSRDLAISVSINGASVYSGALNIPTTDTFPEFIIALAAAWPSGSQLTAEACGKVLRLIGTQTGIYSVNIGASDNIPPSQVAASPVHVQIQNRYTGFNKDILDAKKVPPMCPPTITYEFDSNRQQNLLEDKVFQFRLRYRYDDYEISTWSIISDTKADLAGCLNLGSANNCINVDFDDSRLTDTDWLCIITHVEVAVRESTPTGWSAWRNVKTLGQEDFVLNRTWKFYNDQIGSVITNAESGKKNDAFPIKARTIADVIEEGGQTERRFYGNIVEGYDNECITLKPILGIDDNVGPGGTTGTVRATVRFVSLHNTDPDFVWNQCIHDYGQGPVYGGIGPSGRSNATHTNGQNIPEKGVMVYSAGTNASSLSRQTTFTTSGGVSPDLLDDNVFDTSQSGITTNPNNYYGLAAVQSGINERIVVNEVEVSNLRPGWNVIRVADPRCSFGDTLALGNSFDYNQSFEIWQKTSADTAQVGSITGNPNIIPGRSECLVFVPATGGVIDIGVILIVDHTDPLDLGNIIYRGILLDNDGTPPNPTGNFREGATMEKQLVAIVPQRNNGTVLNWVPLSLTWGIVISTDIITWYNAGVTYTDHNGCYHFSISNGSNTPAGLGQIKGGALTITSDPSNPSGTFLPGPNSLNPLHFQTLQDLNDGFYEGLFEGTLTSKTILDNTVGAYDYVFYNHESTLTEKIRTHIIGGANSVSGSPVSGLLVAYQNGRWALTDRNGDYNILAYGDVIANTNDRQTDMVYLNYWGSCIATLNISTHLAIITQFKSNDLFSDGVPYRIARTTVTASGSGTIRSHKRGGFFKYAAVLHDALNRETAVIGSIDIPIPHYYEDVLEYGIGTVSQRLYGRPTLSLEILGDVPIPEHGRFTHLSIVRTPNLRTNFMVQWAINEVLYVTRWDDTSNAPITTSFGAGDAREIYISIENIKRYADEHSSADTQVAYTFSRDNQDFIEILKDELGNNYNEQFRYPIRLTRVATTGGNTQTYIVIDYQSSLPELKPGMMIEITTPKNREEIDYYYEIARCIPINNPYSQNPTWSQTTIDCTDAGDVYFLSREVPVNVNTGQAVRYVFDSYESEHINDFWYSKFDGKGRSNIITDAARQIDRTNYVVFSNPYLPDTKLNGLSSFEPLSGAPLSKKYGDIEKMAMVNQVLLTICRFNTVSIYPGRAMLQGQNTQLLILADRVIASVREQAANLGTHNPESFIVEEGNAYWFDMYRGIVVMYGYNGLQEISHNKMQSYFKDKGEERYGRYRNARVFGVFDRRYEEYILAFQRVEVPDPANPGEVITEIPYETIAYHRPSQRWTHRYSFEPDAMCSLGPQILSFNAGSIWLHDIGNKWNSFYGISAPAIFKMVGNIFASKNKVMEVVTLETNDPGWYAPEIVTPEYIDQDKRRVPQQETSITMDDFVSKETNLLTASINRDTTSSGGLDNGIVMRGHYITVELRNDESDDQVILYEANIYDEASEWSAR